MADSNLYPVRNTYDFRELERPGFLETREFDVFEKAQEYKAAVIERMHRAAEALDKAGIAYGIAGGNAIASWVALVDSTAVRATQDVDILLNREDLARARKALEAVRFSYRHAENLDLFVDGPEGRAKDGIHLIFAGEVVAPENLIPAPPITEVTRSRHGFFIVTLQAIVIMKLTSHRLKDRVHLQDLLSVGLLDQSWLARIPPELAPRLQHLLDNPEE